MRKRLSASEQLQLLEASGLDYVVLAIACFVAIFRSGDSLQMRAVGLVLGTMCVVGLFVSFAFRRMMKNKSILRYASYPQIAMAVLIAVNIMNLNSLLPGEGFPFQLLNTAYLTFLLVGCSFFIWTDGAMFFMLVPGLALFGILSWLETSNWFEFWLVVFMGSVAVLLTRLHTRVMVATAFAAGETDIYKLRNSSWRSMAGPTLAISSVVAIALASVVISPTVGNTIRNVLGNPDLRLTIRPPTSATGASTQRYDQTIGNGPATASNFPLLRVRTAPGINLIRRKHYIAYRGQGWIAPDDRQTVQLEPAASPPESNLPYAKTYLIDLPVQLKNPRTVTTTVETINRPQLSVPVPGYATRVEYDGGVRVSAREILVDDSLPVGKTFWCKSEVVQPTPDELRAVKNPDREQTKNELQQADNGSWDRRVITLANSVAQKYDNDYDKVQALMREIASRCRYNLKADRISGDGDRVAAFLFETHEGYCDLFASALAVMCRTQGIQARMVVGFRLDPESKEGGSFIVRDRHAHAWTEVYFEGYGMVPFDPTELADAVPGAGVGSTLGDDEGFLTARNALILGFVVVGVLAAVFVAAQIIGWMKSSRRLPHGLKELRSAFEMFMKSLKPAVGRPRLSTETVREYVRQFRPSEELSSAASVICSRFERLFYSGEDFDKTEVDSLRSAVQQFSRTSRTRVNRSTG